LDHILRPEAAESVGEKTQYVAPSEKAFRFQHGGRGKHNPAPAMTKDEEELKSTKSQW
jgi:hypothetical protein